MKRKKAKSKSASLAEELIIFLLHMVTVVGVIDTLVYEGMRVAERFPHSHLFNQTVVNPTASVPMQTTPTPSLTTGEAENGFVTVKSSSGIPRP